MSRLSRNFLLGGRDLWREGRGGAVAGDGDGQAAAFLDFVGDGQGGDDDGQVGLDGVAGSVEHGAGVKVAFGHLKCALDPCWLTGSVSPFLLGVTPEPPGLRAGCPPRDLST